ncbi:MAG: hypothetical protein ACRDLY_20250 [Thermoleophilaceae bacterium]
MQDAWLRWARCDVAVEAPKAYLLKVITVSGRTSLRAPGFGARAVWFDIHTNDMYVYREVPPEKEAP